MLAFLVRRLLWAGLLVVLISVITFALFFALPANAPGSNRQGQLAPNLQTQFNLAAAVAAAAVQAVRRTRRPARRPRQIAPAALDGERDHPQGASGHGFARDRRHRHVASARHSDRDPLGAAAALAAGQKPDDLHPDRGLLPPDLDRATCSRTSSAFGCTSFRSPATATSSTTRRARVSAAARGTGPTT